ncbi:MULTISPECIES: nucleoside-diphosphate kinase [Clostridium]|uniref:Nucleoside diphosphate kinase n=1 Tax=Clostridium cibarium TaxID=2762247 RepID=A0ABR8PNN7_9CLOT|nr:MULTISPECIES: nucleoside-diphosphate kinase [Clostridium]MBD7909757.1 nucleoside-diphosphate kinase [Clostridium cibarium]
MERTLVLIKPDGVEQNIIGKIINFYEEAGLKIVALRMEKANEEVAMRHYEQHNDKFFYQDLIKYITRSPLCSLIIEGEGAIEKVRKINGSTNPIKAEKGTIRNLFAKSVTENCVHASDSLESAEREIAIWFPN